MLSCEKLEKELNRIKLEDERVLERRNKKMEQDLINGKELDLKKKLINFKTQQEQKLIEIQKKWQSKLEVERKKTLHDNVLQTKENERNIVDAKIIAVQSKPTKSVNKGIFGPKVKSNSDGIEKKFNVSMHSNK